jgi:hypothetical protein
MFTLFASLSHLIFKVKYLPEWFPGAGFQKKIKIWRKIVLDMPTTPFQFVKKQLVSFFGGISTFGVSDSVQELGNAKPSVTATSLEELHARTQDHKIEGEEEEFIRHLAGVFYIGGVATVS